MERESVLKSDVRIDICRAKDDICAEGKRYRGTKRRGGYGRTIKECDWYKGVQKNCC